MASKNLSLEDKQKFEKHEEKGQAGSEALSLLQNSLIIPPDDSKFEFITSDGEIIDLKDYKATFEFYSWQYKLPEVSGFKMARLV